MFDIMVVLLYKIQQIFKGDIMRLSILNQFVKSSFAIILLLIVFSSQLIIAGENNLTDEVMLDGTVRWRAEFDGKDFSNSTALNEKSYLRTRLGLKFTSIENAIVYIQFQDSRNLGVNSSGLTNDANLGLHQGYIKLSGFPIKNISMQAGRFEAFYGRHRLIGTVGWHNVGRSFDGVRFSHEKDACKVDLFCLKIDERSFDNPPDHKDWKLFGMHGSFLKKQLNLFAFYDWDMAKVGDENALKRYTAGTYLNHSLESGIKFELDAAFQGGKQSTIYSHAYTDTTADPDTTAYMNMIANQDISAFMAAGEISYKLDSFIDKVGLGFDITSGDDDVAAAAGNDIKSFNNLYYTGHKFRGFMDQFLGTSSQGLMDVILRGSLKPSPKSAILIDIHHFQTMKDYQTSSGGKSKAIGQEIDITGKYSWQKGLGLQGGASVFIASDDWRADADPALWLYAMITAGF